MMDVVNRHHHKERWPANSYYVGRKGRISVSEVERGAIDATILGNPYTVQRYGLEALPRYKRHLWELLKRDESARKLLRTMPDDSQLICSCAPRPCHAAIIKDAVEAKAWLAAERI